MAIVRHLVELHGGTVLAESLGEGQGLTAYAGEINQKQALAVGFKHHITKPVDAEQLVQVITKKLV